MTTTKSKVLGLFQCAEPPSSGGVNKMVWMFYTLNNNKTHPNLYSRVRLGQANYVSYSNVFVLRYQNLIKTVKAAAAQALANA